jgi:hypothetical protein
MHSTNACRQAGAPVGPPRTASLDAHRARLGSTTTPFVIDASFDIPAGLDLQDDAGADSANSATGALGSTREEWVDEWSEDDIVLLHWRLLQEIRHLADPATPLEEKLDTLRWVFTEREKDGLPFSFVNCLRVVGCSPLSPIPYCGLVDAEEVRERIRHGLRPWLHATLARYPGWVREAVATHPEWVEARLTRNPQWINEQLKQMSVQGDLFA